MGFSGWQFAFERSVEETAVLRSDQTTEDSWIDQRIFRLFQDEGEEMELEDRTLIFFFAQMWLFSSTSLQEKGGDCNGCSTYRGLPVSSNLIPVV